MLIDVIGEWGPHARPTLTPQQSRSLLDFCLACGAMLFTVNFVYSGDSVGEGKRDKFYQRLAPFLNETQMLENLERRGFAMQECWNFNPISIDLILDEVKGDLLAYDCPNNPEDWIFYRGDSIFFQTVTHEKEAALRLTEAEYDSFKRLQIPHGQGRLQWTHLPEMPKRQNQEN